MQNVIDKEDYTLDAQTQFKAKLNSFLAIVTTFYLRFENAPVAGFEKLDTLSELALEVSFD